MSNETSNEVKGSKGRPANVALIITGSDGIDRVVGFQPSLLRSALKAGNGSIPTDPGVRGLVVAGVGMVSDGNIEVEGWEQIVETLTPKGGEATAGALALARAETEALKAQLAAMQAQMAAFMAAHPA